MFLKKFNFLKTRGKKRKRKRKKEDMRKTSDYKLSLDAKTSCYCSECKSVLKSDCTKMACKMAGRLIMYPSCNKDSDM